MDFLTATACTELSQSIVLSIHRIAVKDEDRYSFKRCSSVTIHVFQYHSISTPDVQVYTLAPLSLFLGDVNGCV
jgi:hypothetical protein